MNFIICGAGQVGWQIARHLSGERNDVTVVDNNPDLVRRATDTLDVQGNCGLCQLPRRAGTGRGGRRRYGHRGHPFRRGQYGDLSGGAFGLFRANARSRACGRRITSTQSIQRPLPPRSPADRRGHFSPEKEVAEAALTAPCRSPCSLRHRERFWKVKAQLLGISQLTKTVQ